MTTVRVGLAAAFLAGCLLGVRFAALASGDQPPASIVLLAGSIEHRAAYGCGVIVGDARDSIEVLTAGHNLGIDRLEVITVAGEYLRVRSTRRVPNSDLAVLTTDRPHRAYEVAVRAAEAPIGTRVRMWGPIARQPFTPHDGLLRAIDPRVTDAPDGAVALECDRCDHGDSGTGMFDDRGRLVAIVTNGYFLNGVKLFVLGEGAASPLRAAFAP